jgi:hypothetical protein
MRREKDFVRPVIGTMFLNPNLKPIAKVLGFVSVLKLNSMLVQAKL